VCNSKYHLKFDEDSLNKIVLGIKNMRPNQVSAMTLSMGLKKLGDSQVWKKFIGYFEINNSLFDIKAKVNFLSGVEARGYLQMIDN
jgi:hypothetical protein